MLTNKSIAWQKDSVVRQCGGCQSHFSLSNRKHHCRMCGRVYCDQDTKFRIKDSKLQVRGHRVCQGCHDKWEKDDEVEQCNGCKEKFGFFKRKHHCRSCGKIFCGDCTPDILWDMRCCMDCKDDSAPLGAPRSHKPLKERVFDKHALDNGVLHWDDFEPLCESIGWCKQKAMTTWYTVDIDRNGTLTKDEFFQFCRNPQVRQHLKKMENCRPAWARTNTQQVTMMQQPVMAMQQPTMVAQPARMMQQPVMAMRQPTRTVGVDLDGDGIPDMVVQQPIGVY